MGLTSAMKMLMVEDVVGFGSNKIAKAVEKYASFITLKYLDGEELQNV